MILWRLSGQQHARSFNGGYGVLFDGRWNTVGHAVTYCATSPSLCILEKLVHVQDPDLLPDLVMVQYHVPDSLRANTIEIAELPIDWVRQEGLTQRRGDDWHHALDTSLLRVPSAIVPFESSPDRNVLINHRHPAVVGITILSAEQFVLDPRLL